MEINKMWDKYPELKGDLEEVILLMDRNVKCKDKKIENSIKELIYSGGKLLRPSFSIIASRFGNYDKEKSRAVAAALEILHMATLVHDDIIDDADTRRGKETIQSKYGKNYAVYIGDYLFCVCFKLLATHSASLASIKMDTKAMEKICLGEINQMNSKFSLDTSSRKYLSRISGKTAELFALSFYSGASESGCSEKLSKMFFNIGHNIGMAFQIIDDILDYTSNDEELGKPAVSDIKQGIFNLPLIYAINENKKAFKFIEGKEFLEDSDVDIIMDLVYEYKGVDKAMDVAVKYTNKAFKLIDKLPENQYKYILKEVVEKLLDRTA
ncbi:polyprenyl synthetase family protein [Clostridium hydrogeniformans]|uniref:polyprenyl synthetase family protein n=1 Tax=Clostridium hydrogeniformans TaxID=349933 RepID=UPI000488426C|nr:polyprenyl synthetase family protein [Clostridium hydrogeniformans]